MNAFERFSNYLKVIKTEYREIEFLHELFDEFHKLEPDAEQDKFPDFFDKQFADYLDKYHADEVLEKEECSEELFDSFIRYLEKTPEDKTSKISYRSMIAFYLKKILISENPAIEAIKSVLTKDMMDELAKEIFDKIASDIKLSPTKEIESRVAEYTDPDNKVLRENLLDKVRIKYQKEVDTIQKQEQILAPLNKKMLSLAKKSDDLDQKQDRLLEALNRKSTGDSDEDKEYKALVAHHQEIGTKLFGMAQIEPFEDDSRPSYLENSQPLSERLRSLLDISQPEGYVNLAQLSRVPFSEINQILLDEINKEEEEIDLLNKKIHEKTLMVKDLEGQVTQYGSYLNQLRADHQSLIRQIEELEDTYEDERSLFRGKNDSHVKYENGLLKKIERAEGEEKELYEANEALSKEYNALKKKHSKLIKENADLKKDTKELGKYIDKTISANIEADTALKDKEIQIEKLSTLIEESKELERLATEKTDKLLSEKDRYILDLQKTAHDYEETIFRKQIELDKIVAKKQKGGGKKESRSLFDELLDVKENELEKELELIKTAFNDLKSTRDATISEFQQKAIQVEEEHSNALKEQQATAELLLAETTDSLTKEKQTLEDKLSQQLLKLGKGSSEQQQALTENIESLELALAELSRTSDRTINELQQKAIQASEEHSNALKEQQAAAEQLLAETKDILTKEKQTLEDELRQQLLEMSEGSKEQQKAAAENIEALRMALAELSRTSDRTINELQQKAIQASEEHSNALKEQQAAAELLLAETTDSLTKEKQTLEGELKQQLLELREGSAEQQKAAAEKIASLELALAELSHTSDSTINELQQKVFQAAEEHSNALKEQQAAAELLLTETTDSLTKEKQTLEDELRQQLLEVREGSTEQQQALTENIEALKLALAELSRTSDITISELQQQAIQAAKEHSNALKEQQTRAERLLAETKDNLTKEKQTLEGELKQQLLELREGSAEQQKAAAEDIEALKLVLAELSRTSGTTISDLQQKAIQAAEEHSNALKEQQAAAELLLTETTDSLTKEKQTLEDELRQQLLDLSKGSAEQQKAAAENIEALRMALVELRRTSDGIISELQHKAIQASEEHSNALKEQQATAEQLLAETKVTLTKEKQVELARFMGLLKKVTQQKAISALKLVVERSQDPILLLAASEAKVKEDLFIKGFHAAEVNALVDVPSALIVINQAAKKQLDLLAKEALRALIAAVKAADESVLRKVLDVKSHEELEGAGLNVKNLAFLRGQMTYERMAKFANSRLKNNQIAINTISKIINESEDVAFLELIRLAKENNHLTIKLLKNIVKNLVNANAYEMFVNLANERLQQLDALQDKDIVKIPRYEANILMEQQGFLDFNDEKVNKDKLGEGLPQLQGNYKKGTEVGSSLQDTFGVYKGARLGNEDIVRSQKIFGDRVNKDKVAGVALLVQNHTGKVTDQSYGVFTLQQKTEIALKIAQMFLLNYKAGNQNKNEIYIRGQNLEMSNKVFATLMFFKQNDPSLKDLIIKSSNPDGIGPQYKWHTRDKVVDHTFIQDHLDSIVLLQLGQAASKQSAQSRETFYPTEDKGKNIKTNINNLLSNLYEGDEIAAEGLIRKEHTQEPQPQLSHKVEAKQKIQKLLKYFKLDINDIADNQVFRAATNLHHKLQELHEQMFNKPIDFDSLKMFSEQCKTAINENITLKTYFEDDNCLENLSKEITTVIAKFVSLSFKEGIAAVKESNVEQVDAEEDQTIQEEGVGRNIVP